MNQQMPRNEAITEPYRLPVWPTLSDFVNNLVRIIKRSRGPLAKAWLITFGAELLLYGFLFVAFVLLVGTESFVGPGAGEALAANIFMVIVIFGMFAIGYTIVYGVRIGLYAPMRAALVRGPQAVHSAGHLLQSALQRVGTIVAVNVIIMAVFLVGILACFLLLFLSQMKALAIVGLCVFGFGSMIGFVFMGLAQYIAATRRMGAMECIHEARAWFGESFGLIARGFLVIFVGGIAAGMLFTGPAAILEDTMLIGSAVQLITYIGSSFLFWLVMGALWITVDCVYNEERILP